MRLCGHTDIVRGVTGRRLCMSLCASDEGDVEYAQNCDIYPFWEIRTVQSDETDQKYEDGLYEKTGSEMN